MRFGMFVTATFHGHAKGIAATVPATAILHLHDRDWVYVPDGNRQFRRVEVVGGNDAARQSAGNCFGHQPGQQVVANALVLQNTVEQ